MHPHSWKTTARVLLSALALHAGVAEARLDISKRLPAQPKDPSSGTPVASGGGGSEDDGLCEPDPQQCLGVVGLSCDGVLSTDADVAIVAASGLVFASGIAFAGAFIETSYSGCAPDGSCVVNAGSWDHDECCFDHPAGHFCGIEDAFASGSCTAAWDKAVHRVVHGLNWRRRPDRCLVDDDGQVDFPTYCAPPGTIVASGDRTKCCGRRTRRFDFIRDGLQAISQALILDGSYTPRVCVGRGPTGHGGGATGGGAAPVAPICTTNASCPADSICMSIREGEPKHCVAV